MFDVLVTIGDAWSQFIGRLIPVRYYGRWHHYTRTANESISGASHWHAENGRWPWVMRVIDFVFYPFESQHCLKSRINDRMRAEELLSIPGPTL